MTHVELTLPTCKFLVLDDTCLAKSKLINHTCQVQLLFWKIFSSQFVINNYGAFYTPELILNYLTPLYYDNLIDYLVGSGVHFSSIHLNRSTL